MDAKKKQELNEQLIADLRKMAGLPIMEKHGHYAPLEGDEIPQNDVTGDHHKPKKGAELPPKSTGDVPPTDADSTASLPDGSPAKKGDKGDGETPAYPEVVSAMAAKMEGKTGDELVELVSKLYDAGVKDGMAQAAAEKDAEKDGEKEPKKEKKEKSEDAPKEEGNDEEPLNFDEPAPEEKEKAVKEAAEVARLRRLINY
jgi:hypothetical protein